MIVKSKSKPVRVKFNETNKEQANSLLQEIRFKK